MLGTGASSRGSSRSAPRDGRRVAAARRRPRRLPRSWRMRRPGARSGRPPNATSTARRPTFSAMRIATKPIRTRVVTSAPPPAAPAASLPAPTRRRRGGRPAAVDDLVEVASEPAEPRGAERPRELAARQVLGLRNGVERRKPHQPRAEPQPERASRARRASPPRRRAARACAGSTSSRRPPRRIRSTTSRAAELRAGRRRTPPRARRARRGRRGARARRPECARRARRGPPERSSRPPSQSSRRRNGRGGAVCSYGGPSRISRRLGAVARRRGLDWRARRPRAPRGAVRAPRRSRSGERRAEIDGPSVDAVDLAQLLQRRRVVGRALGARPRTSAPVASLGRTRAPQRGGRAPRARRRAALLSSRCLRGFQPGGGGQ